MTASTCQPAGSVPDTSITPSPDAACLPESAGPFGRCADPLSPPSSRCVSTPGAPGDSWCDVRLMLRLSKIDVLVVDDWAMTPLSEAESRDFWKICEDRYQARSLILTSQMPVARWHEQIGDRPSRKGFSTAPYTMHTASSCAANRCGRIRPSRRSAEAFRGLCIVEAGTGRAVLSPVPLRVASKCGKGQAELPGSVGVPALSPACGRLPPLRSGWPPSLLRLDETDHLPAQSKSQCRFALRRLIGFLRTGDRFPSGMTDRFQRNTHRT